MWDASFAEKGCHMIQSGYCSLTLESKGGTKSTIHPEIRAAAEAGAKEIQNSPDRLTRREQEVLNLIAEGRSTKEIAARLDISFKTAVCHRSHIMAKTGSRNCVTLILYAIRHGLIDP